MVNLLQFSYISVDALKKPFVQDEATNIFIKLSNEYYMIWDIYIKAYLIHFTLTSLSFAHFHLSGICLYIFFYAFTIHSQLHFVHFPILISLLLTYYLLLLCFLHFFIIVWLKSWYLILFHHVHSFSSSSYWERIVKVQKTCTYAHLWRVWYV